MLTQESGYAAAYLEGWGDQRTRRRRGVVAGNPRDLVFEPGDRPRSRASGLRPLAEFSRVIGEFPQRQPRRLGLVGRCPCGSDDCAVRG
jgi:hypothetical protein